uniref:Reverse transcriptase domain-containing protein n=1 Tax=Tanacetum cinerariifolium TaxID=118510 RepID=A0A6L2PAE0_TANCI|nr:reverse transcriptase domain-containing protein [Tanacetum cinerariifolium]
MANTTSLVTTVTKPATNLRDADATPGVNIQDLCEEYYEDILPIFMGKVRRDKRKEVHARLNFKKSSRERRTREDSHYSSARSRTTKPERLTVRDRLRYGDRHVLDRLGYRRQSTFDRLSDTNSPSTTKSKPRGTDSRDHPRGRSHPYRLDTPNEDCPKDKERFRGVGESYDDSFPHSYRDGNRSRHIKRRRDNESPLSSVSKSDSSDERYRKSRSKRPKTTDEDDLTRPWMREEEDPFTPRICNFESSRRTRMPNNVKTYDGTGDPEDHVKIFQVIAQVKRWEMPTWCHMFNSTLIGAARVWFDELSPESVDCYKDLKAAFLAYFMQQKKHVKDLVEFHNIKQKDGETIEDFIERFKVETGRMKGAPESMRISGFMHMVNNPELTKRLNEYVSKTMEEMMITTIAFIQGEVAAASKKKGHTSWKAQDQSKRQTSEKRLLVTIGDADHSTKAWMNFMILRSLSPYNGIIGRPEIREIQAVPFTSHGMLKFPVEEGIVTIRSTILIPAKCTSVITSSSVSKEEGIRPENFKVALHPDFPDQEVAIGETLSAKGRTELCSILKKNLDIIAWKPSDMTGVPRSVAEHRLNIQEGYSPVRQKKRGQAPERAKAIQAKVQKLVEAGIMREVYYHDWLSNPVMVKKHDGSWRMCVDFTNLNKSCPQDCYPLPEIDWKVESLGGYPFKCFLDAYKGYHQIQLAESDEEKTTFHTGQGVYCYTKMPFGLKNAGATYQRLVDKAFDNQFGRNIEVYVDDLVVKSYTEAGMLRDIDETFRTLRKINMKLNPKKCTFGAAKGVFLGYVVTPERIKPCPDKTTAVLQLPSPRTIKEVKSLNGKLASLNRFLSKSAEKSLPLLKTLKKCIKKSDFHWTAEAEQAFKQLKQHLSELPLLLAPKPKEDLTIQETSEVFPSASYHDHYRSAHQANHVSSRRDKTTTKIGCHARRTQYHVPAKNASQRTDPSGFSYRNAGRKSASRASGRNSTRAVDTLHGWLIMCGWVMCWAYTDKPGGNRVSLRAEISVIHNR